MKQRIFRRRRHERGAALVEAAFMFPLLIILFFSCIYAHSYSATKIDEATQARELAWTNAMGNCGKSAGSIETEVLPDKGDSLSLTRQNFRAVGSPSTIVMSTTATILDSMNGTGDNTQTGASQALSGGSIEGAFAGIMGMVLNAVSSIFPDSSGSQAASKGSVAWRLPNNYAATDPSNSTSLTNTVTVACNEKVQNGSVEAVVADIFGSITSFVSGKL